MQNKSSLADIEIEELIRHVCDQTVEDHLSVPIWPPDVFAVVASILRRSGAYIAVANGWPPPRFGTIQEWAEHARAVGTEWRSRFMANAPCPDEVSSAWQAVKKSSSVTVNQVSADRDLIVNLMSLVAFADEACWGVGIPPVDKKPDIFQSEALRNIAQSEIRATVCSRRINPWAAVVLPKCHTPMSGLTIRSMSHNLAIWDRPEVSPVWNQVFVRQPRHGLNILLLPWPRSIEPRAFYSVPHHSPQMDKKFGFFTYKPACQTATELSTDLKAAVSKASSRIGRIDMVVLPEVSMDEDSFRAVSADRDLSEILLVAGTGKAATSSEKGTNRLMVSLHRQDSKPEPWTQDKHHRWRLDGAQIDQYGLGSSLDRDMHWWWESIHMHPRACAFFSINPWLTFCALICEDLARQDPVAELVRSVGPNLILSVLLDGPQLRTRWSARYATVLADDPRCSVLTLTSVGMVDLTTAQGLPGPRSIALWKDPLAGSAREICLDSDSAGVALSLSREMLTEWTADGRSDGGSTGYLRLTGVHQLSANM